MSFAGNLKNLLLRLLPHTPHTATVEPGVAEGGALEQDIYAMAEWISRALQSSGYRADFSLESIAEIERFFAEQSRDGVPLEGGLLAEQLGPRLFALGSYCGETLRRALGGEWLTDDDDPEGEIHVALQFSDGSIIWPVERVMKRLDSEDDNLTYWANHMRRHAK